MANPEGIDEVSDLVEEVYLEARGVLDDNALPVENPVTFHPDYPVSTKLEMKDPEIYEKMESFYKSVGYLRDISYRFSDVEHGDLLDDETGASIKDDAEELVRTIEERREAERKNNTINKYLRLAGSDPLPCVTSDIGFLDSSSESDFLDSEDF